MNFSVTLINILMLLVLALPGYALVKFNKKHLVALPTLSIIALYITQPMLTIYSFQNIEYSTRMLKNIGICFGVVLLVNLLLFAISMLVFSKNIGSSQMSRICAACSYSANYGFFGMPVLQMLFPNNNDVIVYSAVAILVLQLLSWTVSAFLVTGDRSFISVKRALLNPTVFALAISMLLYLMQWKLPIPLYRSVSIIGNATTPIIMIVLGMRFASSSLRDFFTNKKAYITVLIKLALSPLMMLAFVKLVPLDDILSKALIILFAMPPAVIVLNFAEIYDKSPVDTANIIMLGNLLSIITIPLVTLLM